MAQIPGTRALRTFDAAARHLNFTRAADELGLTPAAVSHQIKEIEDQLGVVLFARTSRTMQLTEAGSIIHAAAVEALGGSQPRGDAGAQAGARHDRSSRSPWTPCSPRNG